MNAITKIIMLFFLCAIVYGCHNECEGVQSTSAEFKIYEPLDKDRDREVVDGDTLVGVAFFEAQDSSKEVISYQWKIGSDPRTFTQRSFTIEFDNIRGAIPVRLIVKKTVNKSCFPYDDGIDTLTKTFYTGEVGLVYGNFEGYVASKPTEIFTISTLFQPQIGFAFVSNLPNGCPRDAYDATKLSYYGNYRKIVFGTTPNLTRVGSPDEVRCQFPWGTGEILRGSRTLVLDYTIWSSEKKQFVKDRFIGTKK
jgi:hypothetical protein